jgi:hypothetical protein
MTSPAESVSVTIVAVVTEVRPPATTVRYQVRNHADATMWLVDDQWLTWLQRGRRIELSFNRVRMRPGAHVFGYFPPSVTGLPGGGLVVRSVRLTWPQPLAPLWNTEARAAPPPGEYEVSVRIGYGSTPEPDAPQLGESVEDPVLRWQREALSPPATLQVPPYQAVDGDPA